MPSIYPSIYLLLFPKPQTHQLPKMGLLTTLEKSLEQHRHYEPANFLRKLNKHLTSPYSVRPKVLDRINVAPNRGTRRPPTTRQLSRPNHQRPERRRHRGRLPPSALERGDADPAHGDRAAGREGEDLGLVKGKRAFVSRAAGGALD